MTANTLAAASMQPVALLVVVVLPWLLLETWRSRRHEHALRAAGAIEPADDVIAWMRIVYPGMFVAMKDPSQIDVIQEVEFVAGKRVYAYAAPAEDIAEAISRGEPRLAMRIRGWVMAPIRQPSASSIDRNHACYRKTADRARDRNKLRRYRGCDRV